MTESVIDQTDLDNIHAVGTTFGVLEWDAVSAHMTRTWTPQRDANGELINLHSTFRELRSQKPHLFAKLATDMDRTEYAASKADLATRPAPFATDKNVLEMSGAEYAKAKRAMAESEHANLIYLSRRRSV